MSRGSQRQSTSGWEANIDEYLPDPLFQDVWPQHGRIKATRLITPLYQGDHVGLSGLYAILNAFRLALAPTRLLNMEETRQLATAGIRYIEAHGQLSHAMLGGIRLSLWRRLAEALRDHAAFKLNAHIHIDQPFRYGPAFTAGQLLRVLETMVQRQTPVIILRRGGRYTIVSGYTPLSLILFDSFGQWWIKRESCGVKGDANVRHRLYSASLMTVIAH